MRVKQTQRNKKLSKLQILVSTATVCYKLIVINILSVIKSNKVYITKFIKENETLITRTEIQMSPADDGNSREISVVKK
jgi:hypothetical protein